MEPEPRQTQEYKLQDPEEEFTTSWSDPNWYQLYQLHHNHIYDYFQCSPFYNNRCSNAVVVSNQMSHVNFDQALKSLQGTEYKTDFETKKHDPNLSEYTTYNVIYQHHRSSPTQTDLDRIYYCPGLPNHPQFGCIFPMPSINMVFNNKLRTAVHHLNNAIKPLQTESLQQLVETKRKQTQKKVKSAKSKKQKATKSETNATTEHNQYSSLVQGLIVDIRI